MRNRYQIMRKMALPALLLLAGLALWLPGHSAYAEEQTWGPQNRATYSWNSPADHVTFNSITDNPQIGDERNFVRIKEYGTNNKYDDNVKVEPGKEYEVYVFYHNNAAANLNASGKGLSSNTRLSMSFPEKIEAGTAGIVKGTITAANSDPASVWDEAFLNTDTTVYMRYVANSAVIHNAGTANGQIINGDYLLSENGASIAYWNDTWGVIPGCNEYAGYITFRIKADQPGFTGEKQVAAEGTNEYADTIVSAPGDVLNFRISYKNVGTTAQNNVTLHDTMPTGLTYVAGTTYVVSPLYPSGTYLEDVLTDGGVVLGDMLPGEEATLTYKAALSSDTNIFPCGETTIYNNSAIATINGTIYDKVGITVSRSCSNNNNNNNNGGSTTNTGGSSSSNGTSASNSGTPTSLPNTGPAEIIMASVILILIGAGGVYWWQSYRKLHKVSGAVSGAKGNAKATPAAGSAAETGDIVKDGIVNKK